MWRSSGVVAWSCRRYLPFNCEFLSSVSAAHKAYHKRQAFIASCATTQVFGSPTRHRWVLRGRRANSTFTDRLLLQPASAVHLLQVVRPGKRPQK
ncbi:hypothetical protein CSUI_006620 [Cystoisospora suis]|uniref:Uncharacterized protein n=1 Tax=Cystoisospora suis TaxID=483139 RepID=A0A2C6KR60_9APIC|nr:hypothetical protein CSUI_006620 [Cystoisospora suis]